MASYIKTSIVIPTYNQWRLTQDCLRSLANTIPQESCEVLVVDNGSGDETRQACPSLGQELFGKNFRFLPQERNINFGPASNLGARHAHGDFLLFLNNDTLALPGWYEPLLKDFEEFPRLAGTGPVLMYPGHNGSEDSVQHLGVCVTPMYRVGHLYEGIPASSLLTRKRRFFQSITAAVLLMPRDVFMASGGFDERFINGFEDVDLCARLWHSGYRFTCNPTSRLYHLTSQTPGRHAYECQNSALLAAGSLQYLAPDWHAHLANDGLELNLSPWQTFRAQLSNKFYASAQTFLRSEDEQVLRQALDIFPFAYELYEQLAGLAQKRGDQDRAHWLRMTRAKLDPQPSNFFRLLDHDWQGRDLTAQKFVLDCLISFCMPIEYYDHEIDAFMQWSKRLNLQQLSRQCALWKQNRRDFHDKKYRPYLEKLSRTDLLHGHSPLSVNAYTLWRETVEPALRSGSGARGSGTGHEPFSGSVLFSIVMPVYNPKSEHIVAAIDSLCSQEYANWELCMADDASTDPEVRGLLNELKSRDKRIRVEFRDINGNIAAASNTALDMVRGEYVVLLDQDDILPPDALREVARAIEANPSVALIYSDEDKLDSNGARFFPYFKSGWDPVLAEGQNMVSHLGVYKTSIVREIGGFRPGYDGSQDYDLLWRFVERISPAQITHIPRILYHWRAHEGSVALGSGEKGARVHDNFRRALGDHLARIGLSGEVQAVPGTQYNRVVYAMPSPQPLVSIVLDAGGDIANLYSHARRWLEQTRLDKQELLLLAGPGDGSAVHRQFSRWVDQQPNVRIVESDDSNWGRRQGAAVREARGQVLGFVGKGVLPAARDCIRELVSRACLPHAGAVGGRLVTPDGHIAGCGLVVDSLGRIFHLHRGLTHDAPGYFSWAKLARTVTALDARCFFVHKAVLDEFGGLGEGSAPFVAAAFCIKAAAKGYRNIFTPFASLVMRFGEENTWSAEWDEAKARIETEFLLTPGNPNLVEGPDGWALAWNTTPPEADR